MRVMLQPAYVLHHRVYRETSLLLTLFTQKEGVIHLIARGVRNGRSRFRALLQPFIPILVSWVGRSELMTLTSFEPNGMAYLLRGHCLVAGFYLNELLIRLLQKQDPYPVLYNCYEQTLQTLQSENLHEKILRLFEKKLLEELGYGLQLQHDFLTKKKFIDSAFYRYDPSQGFTIEKEYPGFKGSSLRSLAAEQLDESSSLYDAKRIMRLALAPLLGEKPLNSRKLFVP